MLQIARQQDPSIEPKAGALILRLCLDELAAHPDAIELPQAFIENGWVRVAVQVNEAPVGFSVVVPTNGSVHELDGLFVSQIRCPLASGERWLKTQPRVRQITAPKRLKSPQGPRKRSMKGSAST